MELLPVSRPLFCRIQSLLMSESLRQHFLLEDDVLFLNHGSFGACPKPVFQAYQDCQLRLERQPVRFFVKELWPAFQNARKVLGDYLGAPADCIVPVANATFGVNVIAHSMNLQSGDEILSNEHEYGACIRAWDKICRKTGAKIVTAVIPNPIESLEQLADAIWSQVTDRTKILFISHITSPSGIIFPAEELCRRAKAKGILTIVDGAHCAGQIPLNLSEFPADFYTGNCHKWLCAPKGSAFLHAKPEVKHLLEPLVVSWGGNNEMSSGDPFVDELQWQGTNDPAAFLAVPAAIEFQKAHNWDAVRSNCQEMVRWTKDELEKLSSVEPWYPTTPELQKQMAAVMLPQADHKALKTYLEEKYKIEIPVGSYKGTTSMRVSVQGYTTQKELETLIEAIQLFS